MKDRLARQADVDARVVRLNARECFANGGQRRRDRVEVGKVLGRHGLHEPKSSMLGAQESLGKRSTQRAIVSVACMRGTILRGARLAVIDHRRGQRIEGDDCRLDPGAIGKG